MESRTHPQIDSALCGRPSVLAPGRAEVILETTPAMAVDAQGLVHGGFVFGAADYAAMLAVNHPHVVLAGAEVRFLAPVAVGDRVVARAEIRTGAASERDEQERAATRPEVAVEATVGERTVLTGILRCAVLDGHVLAGRRTSASGGSKGDGR